MLVLYIKKQFWNEFEKKGFNSFNSSVKGWKLMDSLNKFEIFSLDPLVWLTNSFNSKHFHDFVRGEIRDEITKQIIVNGQSGRSWYFKRFEHLSVIVVSQTKSKKLILS